MQTEILQQRLTAGELLRKETQVLELLARSSPNLAGGTFRQLSGQDLSLAFDAIDEVFLDGELRRASHQPGKDLGFRVATRMTHTGGTTLARRNSRHGGMEYTISVSPQVIHNTFQTVPQAVVCGLVCRDMRMALLRIMQHEMIHLAEFLVWKDSSCAAPRFRSMVRGLFGHTESKHRMLTPAQRAQATHQVAPGDPVEFLFEGVMRRGRVNRIHRRATVLVADPAGQRYSDGGRYLKFYVPLNQLRVVARKG